MLDEHPERRAPVADVVLSKHGVPLKREHARDRVTDDRRPQVTDVHLLRHVRPRVVDHDSLGCLGGWNALAFVAQHRFQRLGQESRMQRQVDEPRTGHDRLRDDIVGGQAFHDGRRHFARVLLQLFTQRQGHVRLVVGVRRAMNHRIGRGDVVAVRRADRAFQTLSKRKLRVDCRHSNDALSTTALPRGKLDSDGFADTTRRWIECWSEPPLGVVATTNVFPNAVGQLA